MNVRITYGNGRYHVIEADTNLNIDSFLTKELAELFIKTKEKNNEH